MILKPKPMKIPKLIFVFSAVLLLSAKAQKARPLTAISGHYKQLAKLSTNPQPDSSDRRQFPLEGLSPKNPLKLLLKPQYLLLPANEFEIPDFPANSSTQTKAEIAFLLELQATARTEEKVKESLAFAYVYYNVNTKKGDADFETMQRNLFHIGRQLPYFKPEMLPITTQMMTKMWSDATYYFWALKFKHNRTRPYMLDARIKKLNDTNFQAYPSGHASASYVAAYIYQELLPEHTNLFVKNAYDMAFSREILGVHFPSDSEAGRVFARQFVNQLLKNETFKIDLEAARREIQSIKNQPK